MKHLCNIFICLLVTIAHSTDCYAQSTQNAATVDFRHGSEILYAAFSNNSLALERTKAIISENESDIISNSTHIRLVSIIPSTEKGNVAAINLASIRGAIIRKWIRDNYPALTDDNFTFYISAEENRNAVEISSVDFPITNNDYTSIFFSLDKGYPEKIDYQVARYKRVPFIDGSDMFEQTGMDFNIIDTTLDPTITTKQEGVIDKKTFIIYYRWDKDNLDSTYLSNRATLHQIDSLLHLKSVEYIDSLRVIAYASPEGPPDYNKRLSERRAKTIKDYLLRNYPDVIKSEQIYTDARGENWDGFRKMAEADPKLPMKERVLSIIDDTTISDVVRQSRITKLDGGRLYRNYILPNYYRYLRNGASVFVVYNPGMPVDIDFVPINVTITEPEPEPVITIQPDTIVRYPIALRTNLLYDAVGALNIGVEYPFGPQKNWSVIADIAYAYWRSSKNLYALQTLEYGAELRYWLGVNEARKARKPNWAQPLKGFYVGAYGRYFQRYDVQFIDGYQGDGSWSAGLTAGYAIPLNRSLSLDLGIGAGWFSTSQYRHYHQPEYDQQGKYHLMWQETGSWSGLSLTKIRVSLVWLIQTKSIKKGGKKL